MERLDRAAWTEQHNAARVTWVTEDTATDGLGRVLSKAVLLDSARIAVTAYEYDDSGNIASITQPDRVRTTASRGTSIATTG